MTLKFSRLRASHFVVLLVFALLAKAEASSKALEEEFQRVIVPSYDGWFVASQDDVVALMRRGIAERDTKFLIGLLWTQERLVFNQVLHSIPRLPTQEKYELLGLLVAEDSFWRDLRYQTDRAVKVQADQQAVVAAGVTHMIQQEVTVEEFYDEQRRRELQRIVADVVKHGLPNRDPNWKPKEFVGDPSPKKAITIKDPFKNQTNAPVQTPMPTSPPSDEKTNDRPEAVVETPEQMFDFLSIPKASIAILGALIVGSVLYMLRRKSR